MRAKDLIKKPLELRQRAVYEKKAQQGERLSKAQKALRAFDASDVKDVGRIADKEVGRILASRTKPVTLSVVVPSKDHPDILERCVRSLARTVDPKAEQIDYELIVVDNGSSTENRSKYNEILDSIKPDVPSGCRYLYQEEPFHFSRMCNRGANEARGELLLFLNDDVEAKRAGWVSELVAFALKKETGAVGAKLLYPYETEDDALIQHCGVVNTRLGPVHKLLQTRNGDASFWDYHVSARKCLAVTGACLMIRRALFLDCGGFADELPVAFNDVDLCYRLYEAGYENICDNRVFLAHHESVSRGQDTEDAAKMMRLAHEYRTLMERHNGLVGVDPYYDERLTAGARIAVETRLAGERDPLKIAASKPVKWDAETQGYKEDGCVHVGMEFANHLGLWIRDAAMTKEQSARYYFRGFSFVAGADNALYERKLLLQRVEERDGAFYAAEDEIYAAELTTSYRPDIAAEAPDQTNVLLCGIQACVPEGAIPSGMYRIGVASHKRYSGQRLYNWGLTILYADK